MTYIDFASANVGEAELRNIEVAIDALRRVSRDLSESIFPTMQLPEGNVLDLASRGGDRIREFRHIVQMCMVQAEHLMQTNRIKTNLLVTGYLDASANENPLIIFLVTRSLLELAAFLSRVRRELEQLAAAPSSDWRSRGNPSFASSTGRDTQLPIPRLGPSSSLLVHPKRT